MTPARSRTPRAALLVALAVACGAAGGLLLAAAPEATGADAGQVPVEVATPAGGTGPAVPDARSLEHPRAPRAARPRPQPGAPARLLIGSARLRAPVVPVGVRGDGQLALPGEVLRARGVPRLVLITCGGPFDQVRHSYRDNLVVYAVPA